MSSVPRQQGITPQEPEPEPVIRDENAEELPWQRRLAKLSSQISQGAASRVTTAYSAISSRLATQNDFGIVVHPDVRKALRERQAVVALESTIISHGMPYPQNLRTALEVEDIVRQVGHEQASVVCRTAKCDGCSSAGGAVPATIAVLGGIPHVGLTQQQLEHIAQRGLTVQKTSRRDLPMVIARQLDGATTVSATMLLAHRAGIPIFVTGGIGGVHRGGESSMDVSADLTELARTPITVVCAGVKSILDIPRTLEVLETLGVCVAAYHTDEFPAFFSASSGCAAPARVDNAAQAAALVRGVLQLDLGSGVIIGVPIPQSDAAGAAHVEAAISRALKEADAKGLKGAAVTPFVLDRVQRLTGGASLAANIRLVKNNARTGTAIAVALAQGPTEPGSST